MVQRPREEKNKEMKQHRIVAGVLLTLLLLIITACGGGGGTGTGSTTGNIKGPVVSIRVEAVLNGTNTYIDPTNIFPGEVIQFRLSGIDQGTVGQPRVVLPTSGWTSVGNIGGTFDSSGVFTAGTTPTGVLGSVSANSVWDTKTETSPLRMTTPIAVLTGRGRLADTTPTPNVQIDALNSSGTVVATGLVAADGSIRMSVPITGVKFTATFPGTFYVKQFAYNGLDYATTVPGCTANLPALTNGVTTPLATDVVFYSSFGTSPPPPPDGCS